MQRLTFVSRWWVVCRTNSNLNLFVRRVITNSKELVRFIRACRLMGGVFEVGFDELWSLKGDSGPNNFEKS